MHKVWIAHRGAPNGEHPENSLSAFRAAIQAGFRWLEFDLRLSLDGHFVVLHDSTPSRTCQVPESERRTPTSWLTLDQLKSYPFKQSSEVLPTFSEMLPLLEMDPQVHLWAELKDHSPQAAYQLVAALAEHPHRDRIVVQSFEFRQLKVIRQESDLQVCPLYRFRSAGVDELDCQWEAPMAEGLLLCPSALQQAKEAGRKVACWYIFAEKWKWLRALLWDRGVDAMMVDTYP